MKLYTDPVTMVMILGIAAAVFLQSVWDTGKTCSGSCLFCNTLEVDCTQESETQGAPTEAQL